MMIIRKINSTTIKEKKTNENGIQTNSVTSAYLYLNSKCDLNCRFCKDWIFNRESILSKDQWVKIIKDLHNIGIRRIIFSGGEPLLYPYLFDLISIAKDKNIYVEIITNGYKLNSTIELLKYSNLDTLKVSLYSTNSILNNYLSQIDDSWEKIMNGLHALKLQNTLTKVVIRHMLIKNNILDITEFIKEVFFGIEADELEVYPIIIRSYQQSKKQLKLENLGYSELLPNLNDILYYNNNIVPKIIDWGQETGHEIQKPYIFGKERNFIESYLKGKRAAHISEKIQCIHVTSSIHIHDDGNVLMCNSVKDTRNTIGNVIVEDLYEILNKSNLQSSREIGIYRRFSECENCKAELMNINIEASKKKLKVDLK